MIDPFTNTVMYLGKPMDAMDYYFDVFLPNSPTKQKLIDTWVKEQQAIVQQEADVELANRAITALAYHQMGS